MVRKGISHGACDYLLKPVTLTEAIKKKKKKSRVIWTPSLHRKFVAAVDQLGGIDNAVPVKILDLMNVEKLTREHVASHLYKYRRSI
ncbi:hypothetical protein P8452_06295 [Trifolium repens]|nr:hypothetical protein P8452_06295 [Trifolium repens]